jgi:serine/threonine-protein kinase HipA
LKLNISEADNALDLELARSVAAYFRVGVRTANEIIAGSQRVVKQWSKIADSVGVSAREQRRMAAAFRLAG